LVLYQTIYLRHNELTVSLRNPKAPHRKSLKIR
jgi:hypothetical protein